MKIERLNADSRKNLLEDLLKRSPNQYGQYEDRVKEILETVKVQKDQALFRYTKEFDGAEVNRETIRVTDAEIEEAYRQIDQELLAVIRKASHNQQESAPTPFS